MTHHTSRQIHCLQLLWLSFAVVLSVAACYRSDGGGGDEGGSGEVADTAPASPDGEGAGETGATRDADVQGDIGSSTVEVSRCTNVCETPDDCDPPDDDPSNWACEDGLCEPVNSSYAQVVVATCSRDFDCAIQVTPLTSEGCQSNDDCPDDTFREPVCVRLRDATFCAPKPGAQGCIGERVETEEVESGASVEVCVNENLSCIEEVGLCVRSCDPEADSPDCPEGRTCSDEGACVCESDDDCPAETTNKCYAGYCGCEGDAVCESREEEGRTFECRVEFQ